MTDERKKSVPLPQHQIHSRDWRENWYVYPVISRRSRGLSIGVNLNPDMACNFDCIYCQVDRSAKPRTRSVEIGRLSDELEALIDEAKSGRLFRDPAFAEVPSELRRINDIAFSGDGEPTTCKVFEESVRLAADARRKASLLDTKIVLITDACYLTKPEVEAGLLVLDENNGEVWAKLDAGTEAYYQVVNRPNYPLQHVIDGIIAASRVRPIVIQSLFLRWNGEGPNEAELAAYVSRLNEIQNAGGQIKGVQVYTIARTPAEESASALANDEVDHIVELVRTQAGVAAESYYGA